MNNKMGLKQMIEQCIDEDASYAIPLPRRGNTKYCGMSHFNNVNHCVFAEKYGAYDIGTGNQEILKMVYLCDFNKEVLE